MRKKTILSVLIMTVVAMSLSLNESKAAVSVQVGTPNLSFSINDYQPAPPNVYVHSDGGRPYYVERDRRVYMEKKHHGKKHKKEKNHNRGNGHDERHDRHGR